MHSNMPINHTLLQAELNTQPYPLLFAAVSGAHLYGFPSVDSDYDVRGVHILPLPEIIGLNPAKDTIDTNNIRDGVEVDLTTHDVGFYFERLANRKSGNFLEQIASPLTLKTSPEFEELKHIVLNNAMTSHFVHHYNGFSQTQWNLFNRNHPRRVKPLLYVYRTVLTGIYLMETGAIETNLPRLAEIYHLTYIAELVERKISGGEHGILTDTDITFHEAEYARLRDALHHAHSKTHLPDHYDARPELHNLLLKIRL